MSIESLQEQINRFDKEISQLESKKATKTKDVADLQKKNVALNKCTTRNISPSMLQSKQRGISSNNDKMAKLNKEIAGIEKQIADKRKKRSDLAIRLQKEQTIEQKKNKDENDRVLSAYESRINDLQQQLNDKMDSGIAYSADTVDEEYDLFISHANEDKKDFVDELVEELKAVGLKVWYDTDCLKVGDSLREKIDKGLSKSRYGIVVLSKNYIAENKYWTKAELNGLFQTESIYGKRILPIWHGLTKKEVYSYSPIIADKKAFNTASMTAQEMAEEFKKLFHNDTL